MRFKPTPLVLAVVLVATATASAADRVWDLQSHLNLAEWAVNYAVFQEDPADPCDAETRFDPAARRLADGGTAAELQARQELERTGGRERQAAAARAYVHLAREAQEHGEFARAADHALHVYLSGAPHRLRLEALRVFCATGAAEEVAHQLELIASGRQDPLFQPALDELRRKASRDGC
jgi:hypothetical protein